jgi:predicted dehydrogenase
MNTSVSSLAEMQSPLPEYNQYRVLVVGCGSIGRRHTSNLRSLGVAALAACDPDPQRRQYFETEWGLPTFPDLESGLNAFAANVVFVCSPPVFHVSQALVALDAGAHVFVEKPVSDRIDGIAELIERSKTGQRVVQVGYNLRFHPGLVKLKSLLDQGIIGKVLWARIEAGQYLPDWRPWQDYKQSYTARRDLGGGILLDGSHEIDYALWFFGQPSEMRCLSGTVSQLSVDVEDCATILIRFAGGAQVDVHLDFVQRSYSRSCKIVGELGTLAWDFTQRTVDVFTADSGEWSSFPYDFAPNDMYVNEVQDFFRCIAERGTPRVDLQQARAVLEVIQLAKAAAESTEELAK